MASITRRYPRRNIPVVDYTGMDTIYPEDTLDGNTDILNKSRYYDPDYLSLYNWKKEKEEKEIAVIPDYKYKIRLTANNADKKMIQKEFGFDTDIYHHKRFEYCIILEEPGIYTLLFNYLYCHLIGITVNKIRNILGITTHIPIEITNTENGKEYLVTSNNGIFFWEPK